MPGWKSQTKEIVPAFFVAFCAGVAGMLSLTTAKSGALIGVLISVTTIPAAANIAVAFVYTDWPAWPPRSGVRTPEAVASRTDS